MRHFLRNLTLSLSFLLLSACGSMVKEVDYNISAEVPENAHPAPIVYKGVELLLPPGTNIGYQAQGRTFCTIPYQPVNRNILRTALDTKFLRQTFHDALESSGYDVVGSLDLSYAPEDEFNRAEYSIKGKVKDVQVDMCEKLTTPFSLFAVNPGTKGELYVAIDWTVYDPLRRTVVYKTRTEGYTHRRLPNQEGLTLMFQDAFEMAAHNLGSEPGFYDLIVMGKRPEKGDAGYPRKTNRDDTRPRHFDRDEIVFMPKQKLSRTPFAKHSDTLLKSAVMIQKFGHGSGFFITDQGHILTNAHVVGDAMRTRIVTHKNKKKLIAEVLRVDKARDVALLKLETIPDDFKIQTLPIRAEIPHVGEDVFAIGNPASYKSGLRDTVSKGIMSAYREEMKVSGIRENFIQADVDTHGGNSGGMLTDEYGNIIGMSVLGINDSESSFSTGLNYFIPIGEALERLHVHHAETPPQNWEDGEIWHGDDASIVYDANTTQNNNEDGDTSASDAPIEILP